MQEIKINDSDNKALQRICEEVQREFRMGGLSDEGGLYSEYAKQVAVRWALKTSPKSKESNTAYMATSGSYSDYRVDAIFSTKELAKDYIAARSPEGLVWESDIEEIALDPSTENNEKSVCTAWSIDIPINMGEDIPPISSVVEGLAVVRIGARSLPIKKHSNSSIEIISLVSAEHAHKLAVEYRQNQLRQASLKFGVFKENSQQ